MAGAWDTHQQRVQGWVSRVINFVLIPWFCISFNVMKNTWGWSSLLPNRVPKLGFLLEQTSDNIPTRNRVMVMYRGQCWSCTVLKAMWKLFTKTIKYGIVVCAQRITAVMDRIGKEGRWSETGSQKRQLHLELLHARQRGTRRERKLRVGESGKGWHRKSRLGISDKKDCNQSQLGEKRETGDQRGVRQEVIRKHTYHLS